METTLPPPSASQTAPPLPTVALQEAPTSTPTESTPLQIGDTCLVLWRDESTSLKAKIIERRRSGSKASNKRVGGEEPPAKKAKADGNGGEEDNLTAEDFEYYVHYVEHDR